MTPASPDAFDRAEALAERARLQRLLENYDAGRLKRQGRSETGDGAGAIGPDRAGKVRARIARLDQLIGAQTNV